MKIQKSLGFTLVELLVTITIIAILATIGLTIYSSAQKQARIAKRISDLKAIQSALELYYSVNKSYPATSWRTECAGWPGVTGNYSPADVIPGLTPGYLTAMPSDPSMNKTANTSCYVYISDGKDYKLMDRAVSEMNSADYQNQPNLIDPLRDSGTNSCIVDGTGIWAWSIYSSCNPSKCGTTEAGSCGW